MTLATRIIPILLCRGRQLVKGTRFDSWRSVGVALQAAKVHAMRGVDELIILDIGATPEDKEPDYDLVRELTDTCFCPLTIGGGITMLSEVQRLLRAGADKVALGTSAFQPHMVANCAHFLGSQAVVVAVDYRGDKVVIQCGKRETKEDVLSYVKRLERDGAGEILLTSIEREGTMEGYDIEMIKLVSEAVKIPVVANGGCGVYEHMLQAIKAGAHAVAAGAMFQFTDSTPAGAAEYLKAHGIKTRTKERELYR